MTGSPSYKPDDFWHKVFNWELVRGFGQSHIGSASIAMPFIGFALLYHTELQVFLGGLGGSLGVTAESAGENKILSFNTKLNLIYLGSFCVGIGSIVYRLMAPKTIKEFSSISQFAEIEISRATARRLRSMMTTISSRRPEISNDFRARAAWLTRSNCTLKSAANELRNLKDDQLQNDVLSSFYNVENRYTARKSLFFVTLFYAIGFLLLSIPGLVFTLRVLNLIFFS